MNYLNYSNAFWDCFGFHIAEVSNMLQNQAIMPDWAISLDCLDNKLKISSIHFTSVFQRCHYSYSVPAWLNEK